MSSLAGKVALVTGASSGIGKATAGALAEAGAAVVLVARNRERAIATLNAVERAGGKAELLIGDVSKNAFIGRAVSKTMKRYGRIDILVNAAGTIFRGTAADTPIETWRSVMDVNLDAVFFLSRAVVPHMKRRAHGRIINIASTVGLVGCPNLAAYCASKGAVVLLTKAMALDHAKDGICINAICPGAVDTPMLASGHQSRAASKSAVVRNAATIPQGRVATGREIADLVVYLCSKTAGHITGTTIAVDGGFTAQ